MGKVIAKSGASDVPSRDSQKARKKRIFLGIPLSGEVRRGVKKVVKGLDKHHWPVRWVEEECWHMTVAFVGDVSKVSKVSKVVSEGCRGVAPFEVGFKGLGAFPDLVLPKIVWLAVNGDLKSLYRLVKEIKIQLENSGVEFDRKAFWPHVTVARLVNGARRKHRMEMGRQVAKLRRMEIAYKWRVEKVVVYEGRAIKGGVAYRALRTVQLV